MTGEKPQSDYVHIPVVFKEFEYKGEVKFIDKQGKVFWIPKDVIRDLTYAEGLYVTREWAANEGLLRDNKE